MGTRYSQPEVKPSLPSNFYTFLTNNAYYLWLYFRSLTDWQKKLISAILPALLFSYCRAIPFDYSYLTVLSFFHLFKFIYLIIESFYPRLADEVALGGTLAVGFNFMEFLERQISTISSFERNRPWWNRFIFWLLGSSHDSGPSLWSVNVFSTILEMARTLWLEAVKMIGATFPTFLDGFFLKINWLFRVILHSIYGTITPIGLFLLICVIPAIFLFLRGTRLSVGMSGVNLETGLRNNEQGVIMMPENDARNRVNNGPRINSPPQREMRIVEGSSKTQKYGKLHSQLFKN